MVNRDLSDIDLQRLRRTRVDLPAQLLLDFSATLSKFAESSRAQVLKHLKIAYFLADLQILDSRVAELTFNELIELGTFGLCEHTLIKTDVLERLQDLLNNLVAGADDGILRDEKMYAVPPSSLIDFSNGSAFPSDGPLQLFHKPTAVGKSRSIPGPVLSSVESERLLIEGFDTIRNHPRIAEIGQRKLGEYWEADWLRAPFVEAMTFKQIAEMKLANLLEKRMINGDKIKGIILCIERVLQDYQVTQGTAVGRGSQQTETAFQKIWLDQKMPEHQFCRAY